MTQICPQKSIVDFELHHLPFSNWSATLLNTPDWRKSFSSAAAQVKEQKEEGKFKKKKKKPNCDCASQLHYNNYKSNRTKLKFSPFFYMFLEMSHDTALIKPQETWVVGTKRKQFIATCS